MEVRGRSIYVSPPANAAAFIADVTDWMHNPRPLEGPFALELPRGAYLEYAFLDAAGRPFADPDNPRRAENPWYDYARAVGLPGARRPPRYPDRLVGRVERLRVRSHQVVVYEPPEPPRACLLVFDGTAYYRIGRMAQALEALTAAGRAVPARLVFSEPRSRETEYRFSSETEGLVLDAILPEVEGLFGPVERRGLWGASLGGLTALWLALRHPDVFSLTAAQSPALRAVPGGSDARNDPEWLLERYAASPRLPQRVIVQTGLLEWLLPSVRRFAALLAERGISHAYFEYPSGHNWFTWRLGLVDGLLEVLGSDLWEA